MSMRLRTLRCGCAWAVLICSILLALIPYSTAYPVLFEIPEEEEKCIQFDIPKNDDAHMIFLAVPISLSSPAQEWFVEQASELTKARSAIDGALPRKFPEDPPDDIMQEIEHFLEKKKGIKRSGVIIKLQKPHHHRPIRQQDLSWFVPVVINHVERYQRKGEGSGWDAKVKLGGWSICFESDAKQKVYIVHDVILVSENPADDDAPEGISKRHLTPLEEELTGSISAAQSILDEMRYMEKREARMRLTMDSINGRIQYFSYISVGVLLAITYLQVTYLQRYFKKKKLM